MCFHFDLTRHASLCVPSANLTPLVCTSIYIYILLLLLLLLLYRSKFEAKLRIANRNLDAASAEILSVTDELTQERTSHLQSLSQLKTYQTKLNDLEKNNNIRIDELLSDRQEMVCYYVLCIIIWYVVVIV